MNSKEWEEYKFGDIARLVKVQYLPNEQENLAYIGLEHIEQQTLRLSSIGDSSEVVSQKFRFSSGDILFGKLRPYFRKVYRPQFDGVCSTDIWVVRAREGFDQGFLFYFMANQAFVDEANNGSSGTRMPRADWGHMRETIWILPPSTTQHRIANILSALDEKIELNRQTIATLEAIAQAIFKEWFVHYNYPGATGDLVNSELGPIPAGWQTGQLGDFIEVTDGRHDTPRKVDDGFPLITSKHLNKWSIDFDSAYLISEEDYIRRNEGRTVNKFDILISLIGTVGLLYLVMEVENTYSIKNIGLLKSSQMPQISEYLYLFLDSNFGKNYLASRLAGTTQRYLTHGSLREMPIILPPEQTIRAFRQLINPLFSKIHANVQQVQTLTQIRDTLLPKLMRGEIVP